MTPLLLYTHNRGKLAELRALLAADPALCSRFDVLSADDVGAPDVEETGDTFADNAALKARAGAALGYLTVADDSGLVVDALDGAPGVWSARFAGEPKDDEANNRLLLERLADTPPAERGARFVSVICCAFPDGRAFFVEGSVEGSVLLSPLGDGGFGYDPLFFVPQLGCTMAQATPEQKNAVSHRGRAMRLFCERIRTLTADGAL
ncbi:MAG: RdgB/HAM1 family non-canonical purine NTP pyrophosphatase [Clostridia bacterium]|nr:RdgB/HAM1 family non-canonical purine NTP pyrophosphatase [Clostridia bacterium]